MDIVKAIHRSYFWCFLIPVSLLYSKGVLEGTVVDSKSNEPVIGANVFIIETDVGVVTDKDGYFKIEWGRKLPVVLQISHIGYITRQLTVSLPTQLKIRLVPKVLMGEEVTILGERSRSQAEASTAMDVIEIEDIKLQGSRDLGSALRRISSVVINQSSSGVQTISIRGSNPNEVAVFLDGVKINSANTGIADLSQVDLNSLQCVEVLRGGNAYLFGHGNLGGVLNLRSQGATKNSLSLNWGEGMSYDDDRDLSIDGVGILGPFGLGGRYSLKSRAYAGRTLTTSLFGNLFGDVEMPCGKISSRFYQMENVLTYPSGEVAICDNQTIFSTWYRGNIWKTSGWEFFTGNKRWSEEENFFDNMSQHLDDQNRTYRIGKALRIQSLDASLQLEREEQIFKGSRDTYWSDLNLSVAGDGDLRRQINSIAMVGRWITEGDNPIIRRLHLEMSLRLDRLNTNRDQCQVNTYYDSLGFIDDNLTEVIEDFEKNRKTVFASRVGFRMEGLTNKFRYRGFVTQGNNKRLPTLNDLFLKANTSIESLRDTYLLPEYLTSTELNLEISFTEFLMTPTISELELNVALFRNNYDNKIGYKWIINEPPVPYNEPTADINGYEAGILASFINNKFQIRWNAIILNIENPYLFSNRPGYRYVVTSDINLDWLVISYDYFNEGEQFVLGSGFGQLFQPRKNANVNITLKKKLYGVKLSLAYTIRNLMSIDDNGDDSDLNLLFYNYYDQYREIFMLRVSI